MDNSRSAILALLLTEVVAAEQQFDVVAVFVVDPLDGLADEGFDVGRVLANRGQQGFGGNLLGAFNRQAVAEDRPLFLGLLAAVALGQHRAGNRVCLPLASAGRPGHLAVTLARLT